MALRTQIRGSNVIGLFGNAPRTADTRAGVVTDVPEAQTEGGAVEDAVRECQIASLLLLAAPGDSERALQTR